MTNHSPGTEQAQAVPQWPVPSQKRLQLFHSHRAKVTNHDISKIHWRDHHAGRQVTTRQAHLCCGPPWLSDSILNFWLVEACGLIRTFQRFYLVVRGCQVGSRGGKWRAIKDTKVSPRFFCSGSATCQLLATTELWLTHQTCKFLNIVKAFFSLHNINQCLVSFQSHPHPARAHRCWELGPEDVCWSLPWLWAIGLQSAEC